MRPIPGAPPGAAIPNFPDQPLKSPVAATRRDIPATPVPRVEPPAIESPVKATAWLEGKDRCETRLHENGDLTMLIDPAKPVSIPAQWVAEIINAARWTAAIPIGESPISISIPMQADEVRFRNHSVPYAAPGSLFTTTKAEARKWANTLVPRSAEQIAVETEHRRGEAEKARLWLIENTKAKRQKTREEIGKHRTKSSPLTRNQRREYDKLTEIVRDLDDTIKRYEREARTAALFPEFHPFFVTNILLPLVSRQMPWETELTALLLAVMEERSVPLGWADEIALAIEIVKGVPPQRLRDMQMIATGLAWV